MKASRLIIIIVITICVIVLIAIGARTFIKPNNTTNIPTLKLQLQPTPFVSINAKFEIYTNGTKRIFTDPKYHKQSPDVYIEPSDPMSIHITKPGVLWSDFFNTLPMKLTPNCLTTGTGQVFCTNATGQLKFYINSIEQPTALDQTINENDILVVKYTSN